MSRQQAFGVVAPGERGAGAAGLSRGRPEDLVRNLVHAMTPDGTVARAARMTRPWHDRAWPPRWWKRRLMLGERMPEMPAGGGGATRAQATRKHRFSPEVRGALVGAAATLLATAATIFIGSTTDTVTVNVGAAPTEVRTVTVTVPPPVPSSPSPTSSPSASSTGGATQSLLKELEPVEGGARTHTATMGQRTYYDGVQVFCTGSTHRVVWSVPVGAQTLDATVGIDNNTGSYAIGGSARVQFQDESRQSLGAPVTVAIGSSSTVKVPVSGKAQVMVLCTARNPERERGGYSPYFYIELGDASFTS